MNKYYGMQTEFAEENNKTYAKAIEHENQIYYFVKIYRGFLVNPQAGDFFRIKSKELKWRKVSEKTFQHYIKFLNSRNERYLLYAERTVSE